MSTDSFAQAIALAKDTIRDVETCQAFNMVPAEDWRPTRSEIIARAFLTLVSEREWRPIESAPKDGAYIDLWVSGGDDEWRVPDAYYNRIDGWRSRAHVPLKGPVTPTHWKPLPEPPR